MELLDQPIACVTPEKLIFTTACETRRLTIYNELPVPIEYKRKSRNPGGVLIRLGCLSSRGDILSLL